MNTLTLGALKQGMTRLVTKGVAKADFLYDLLNGYVDSSGLARARNGTSLVETLPAGTVGLAYFNGDFHVFASAPVDMSALAVPVICEVLHHPDPDFSGTIVRIHFSEPFLGVMYVAAEFSNGDVYHYWLQKGMAWQADHDYLPHVNTDEVPVTPVAPNGFYYEPSANDPPDAWVAQAPRAVGDKIVPTSAFVANNPTGADYEMEVIEVIGDVPASGLVKPDWTLDLDGLTYEYYQPGQVNPGDGTDPTGGDGGSGGSGGGGGDHQGPGGTRYEF